jgi:hypothetical protein
VSKHAVGAARTVPLLDTTHWNTGASLSPRASAVLDTPRHDPVKLTTVSADTVPWLTGSTPLTVGADVHTSTGREQSAPVQPP